MTLEQIIGIYFFVNAIIDFSLISIANDANEKGAISFAIGLLLIGLPMLTILSPMAFGDLTKFIVNIHPDRQRRINAQIRDEQF